MRRTTRLTAALAACLLPALTVLAQTKPDAIPTPPPLPEGVPAFETGQLNSFTWYGRFGYTNCSWIDLGPGVAVIDTGWSAADGANLAAKIKETTGGKPVKWFVMTQLHPDSNGGFEAFLPTDATIFMNARAAAFYAKGLALRSRDGAKLPTIVGVTGGTTLAVGPRRLELWAPPGAAHSDFDLLAFSPDSATAFVGDLVTTGRCPLCTDPSADPKGWLAALDKIAAWGPAGIIPTRGEASTAVDDQVGTTREYLTRTSTLLSDMKKKGAAEARVASELSMRKAGDYCPLPADNKNALSLYRRLKADGTYATAALPDDPAPAPPVKPQPAKK